MSWKLDENTLQITMTKGDTTTFKVRHFVINQETGEPFEYIPTEHDHYIFAVKKKAKDTDFIISREIPKDTMIVKFKESDTKALSVGEYVWEVSFNSLYGETDDEGVYHESEEDVHDTIITTRVLKLTTEVY